jgi:hypothetical protein
MSQSLNVLHLSFHKGCQKVIDYVCEKLNINCDFMEFDDGVTKNDAKYNIGKERAKKCWDKYMNIFYKYDLIIISDTTPISRVFLQHNFEKRVIIWVCNRFDYADQATNDCNFPDVDYYHLIRSIPSRQNVTIISNTPFENYYARHFKNVDIGKLVIKPCNKMNENICEKIDKFYVVPYHNETNFMNLSLKLKDLGIDSYCGRYDLDSDLMRYKGIIHLPYAWSTIALFERIGLGMIHFIPSLNFFLTLHNLPNYWFQTSFTFQSIKLSEWYCDENRDLFVFFDSWEDLVQKINHTDYDEKRKTILKIAKAHEENQLNLWKNIIFKN